jgi:hypothetical protein
VYSSGHGNDEIDDESGSVTEVDILRFENLNSSDVTLSRSGDHLFVAINLTGETIKVDFQFFSQTANWGIEQFHFANGETWSLATINANAWYGGRAETTQFPDQPGTTPLPVAQATTRCREEQGEIRSFSAPTSVRMS